MKMLTNIKSAYAETSDTSDRGDLVQTLIIISVFAVVALLAMTWLGTAVLNKSTDAATCIEKSSAFTTEGSVNDCKAADKSKTNSYKSSTSYKGRYPTG